MSADTVPADAPLADALLADALSPDPVPAVAPFMGYADAELDASERIAVAGATGLIHSWDLVTAQDGPGTRMTLFMAGCSLRCQYCHNPDSWRTRDGIPRSVEQVVDRVARYKKVMKVTGGGLTISGGEPLLQARFVANVFRRAKADLGIHTALDTSGLLGERLTDEELLDIDLTLLDIKSGLPETYRQVTGRPLQPTLDFARRLSDMGRTMWIRFVLVPGLTDAPDNIAAIADFVAGLEAVERVEVLPFHQLGRTKWAATGEKYLLGDTKAATPAEAEAARYVFRERGLTVF
jgi:pyruvate formate lyase activating enzyme